MVVLCRRDVDAELTCCMLSGSQLVSCLIGLQALIMAQRALLAESALCIYRAHLAAVTRQDCTNELTCIVCPSVQLSSGLIGLQALVVAQSALLLAEPGLDGRALQQCSHRQRLAQQVRDQDLPVQDGVLAQLLRTAVCQGLRLHALSMASGRKGA